MGKWLPTDVTLLGITTKDVAAQRWYFMASVWVMQVMDSLSVRGSVNVKAACLGGKLGFANDHDSNNQTVQEMAGFWSCIRPEQLPYPLPKTHLMDHLTEDK